MTRSELAEPLAGLIRERSAWGLNVRVDGTSAHGTLLYSNLFNHTRENSGRDTNNNKGLKGHKKACSRASQPRAGPVTSPYEIALNVSQFTSAQLHSKLIVFVPPP